MEFTPSGKVYSSKVERKRALINPGPENSKKSPHAPFRTTPQAEEGPYKPRTRIFEASTTY